MQYVVALMKIDDNQQTEDYVILRITEEQFECLKKRFGKKGEDNDKST
jgi:hypothetical protein